MKNILKSALLLFFGACIFIACEDDNDSNPTLVIPETFVLNTPSYSQAITDLATSTGLPFTWSQPNYGGFPVAAQYQMEFSIANSFTTSLAEAEADETGNTVADYFALDQIYSGTTGSVNPSQLAKGLEQLAGWAEEQVPAQTTVYARLASDFANDTIYSNVVSFVVSPYYIELSDAPIELWYIIGSDIADGSWGSDIATAILPLQPIEGVEYDKKTGQGEIQWVGYLAGNGFKLKQYTDSWDFQWGQGESFGEFVKNDGGSGNITVPSAGVYTVKLNTATDKLTVEAYDGTPTVFSSISICGSWTDDWSDNIAMTACNPNSENHDWYLVHEFAAGTEWKVKQTDSWDFNKGGSFVNTEDGMYAFGVDGGANFKMEEGGKYLILFNDITGFVRLIKQ